MITGSPVAQTVQDHISYHGMITVQGIAAAAEIIIFSVRSQHIINVIVKAFEREKRPILISFCRMIKDHIQDHFDPVFMKIPDQPLQFCTFPVILLFRGITGIRRKKAYRIIAPVIQKLPAVYSTHVPGFVKFKYRH